MIATSGGILLVGDGQLTSAASEASLSLVPPFTLRVVLVIPQAGIPAAERLLVDKGTNYQIAIDENGQIFMRAGLPSSTPVGAIDPARFRYHFFVFAGSGEGRHYAGGENDVELRGVAAGIGSAASNTDPLVIGWTGDAQSTAIYHLDLWARAMPVQEMRDLAPSPPSGPLAIPDFRDGWAFEGNAESIVGRADLTASGLTAYILGAGIENDQPFDDGPVLLAENYARDDRGAAIVEATSEASSGSLGPEWLLADRVDRAWQTATLSSERTFERVIVDLGKPRLLDTVMWLLGDVVAAPFRVRTFATLPPDRSGVDAGSGSEVHRSKWRNPIVRASIDDYENFGEFDPLLGPDAEDVSRLAASRHLSGYAHFAPEPARYIFLEFDVEAAGWANGQRRTITVGTVIAGRAWQPAVSAIGSSGVTLGSEWSPEDGSRITRSDGGAPAGRQLPPHRRAAITLTHLGDREVDRVLRTWYETGISSWVFFWEDAGDLASYYTVSIFGFSETPRSTRARLVNPSDVRITIRSI
jgi:hypothetical protein